jgi:hypothetical protein
MLLSGSADSMVLMPQFWLTSHPPSRGRGTRYIGTHPAVHAGFLRSWLANGLNKYKHMLCTSLQCGTLANAYSLGRHALAAGFVAAMSTSITDGNMCRRVIQRLEEIIDQNSKLPDGVQRKIMLTGAHT